MCNKKLDCSLSSNGLNHVGFLAHFDKESRVFFESLKNKFGDSLKNILNLVKNRVESETDCFEDISDTKEYKELKAYCTNLIFFLMQKKKECKALSRKLNTLFQFLCTHLECKDN